MATWEDYEALAQAHLAKILGTAEQTSGGADGGVDVLAPGHAAQVKARMSKAGRPDLQRLVGAATTRKCVFYSLGGFTAQAIEYAEDETIALFEFTAMGECVAVNTHGKLLGSDPKVGIGLEATLRQLRSEEQRRPRRKKQ